MWKDRVIVTLLQSEEVTPLLAEVPIQLLKALLKEEDDQQTVFGPMDLRVSINLIIMLTFEKLDIRWLPKLVQM